MVSKKATSHKQAVAIAMHEAHIPKKSSHKSLSLGRRLVPMHIRRSVNGHSTRRNTFF